MISQEDLVYLKRGFHLIILNYYDHKKLKENRVYSVQEIMENENGQIRANKR